VSASALKSEATRGTTRVWFNIPNRVLSMVNVYIGESGNEFQGAPGNFYNLAVVRLLQEMAPFFRHDLEYSNTIRALESLSRRLEFEEPMAEFRRHLEEAEKAAEICVDVRTHDYGLTIIREFVGAISSAPDTLRAVWSIMLRDSRPMQQLMKAIGSDPRYALSDEVHRLETWMGDRE
jgi:hypothetical protein